MMTGGSPMTKRKPRFVQFVVHVQMSWLPLSSWGPSFGPDLTTEKGAVRRFLVFQSLRLGGHGEFLDVALIGSMAGNGFISCDHLRTQVWPQRIRVPPGFQGKIRASKFKKIQTRQTLSAANFQAFQEFQPLQSIPGNIYGRPPE